VAVTSWIWLLIVVLPASAALGLCVPRLRNLLVAASPWTAIPALAMAMLPEAPPAATVPWMLLGSQLGLDSVETRVFLLFTSLLWTVSGVYAATYLARDRERHRFWFFYQLTMAGNLGLIISQDVATFYFCFTLMTFAGFGLIVHDGSDLARRAGRVYILMAVLGEVMLLTSFILLVFEARDISIAALTEGLHDARFRQLIVALLIGGFGVKAGVIPLHIWLPLAHPVAPTPASAVLSGAMIKAGLLGWLRFLPLGDVPMEVWGTLVVVVGLGAAFAAAVAGVLQKDPKTVLAYSSISQMGIIGSCVGVVLLAPQTRETMTPAISFYALHHGLAKAALFLGVGVAYAYIRRPWHRRLVNIAMYLPALALVGAPLTSGAAAKNAIKDPLALAQPDVEQWLTSLLMLAAVGTTVLMARFLYLIRPGAVGGDVHHPFEPGLWAPWGLLILSSVTAAITVPRYVGLPGVQPIFFTPPYLWQATWPVMAGVVLAWATNRLRGRGYARNIRDIPPGDIIVVGEKLAPRVMHAVRTRLVPIAGSLNTRIGRIREKADSQAMLESMLQRAEQSLTQYQTAGVVLLMMMTTLALVVWRW
jgi:formate hydrogenlyase subunit 3/multisubunit Na+/H+ antiporter MnhD subunit